MTNSHQVRALLLICGLCGVGSIVGAQDEIALRDSTSGDINRFKGTVLEWDSRQLIYTANGRQRDIPSRRVVSVVYRRSDELIGADALFEAGKLPQALQAYENALLPDERPWIIREIRAKRLRCASGLGQYDLALAEFLAIYASNSETRFFHLIPLAWESRPTASVSFADFPAWLTGPSELRGLIAASWLLLSGNADAESRLKQLRQSADSRIAHLATAQLWRTQTVTADEAELRRWQAAIDRMPGQLRAGPRFVAAMAAGRHATLSNPIDPVRLNRAVIAMMRIPVLHADHYQLCGAALAESSRLLAAADRRAESAAIEQELRRDFRYSTAAIAAQQRFQDLDDKD